MYKIVVCPYMDSKSDFLRLIALNGIMLSIKICTSHSIFMNNIFDISNLQVYFLINGERNCLFKEVR